MWPFQPPPCQWPHKAVGRSGEVSQIDLVAGTSWLHCTLYSAVQCSPVEEWSRVSQSGRVAGNATALIFTAPRLWRQSVGESGGGHWGWRSGGSLALEEVVKGRHSCEWGWRRTTLLCKLSTGTRSSHCCTLQWFEKYCEGISRYPAPLEILKMSEPSLRRRDKHTHTH